MGKIYSLIAALFLSLGVAYASDQISYEYWFDNAYTSKTEGSIGEGSNAINFDIDNLPQGVHFFNFRLGYGNGSWGSVYRKMFLNLSGTEDDVSFEYWIDGDYSAKTTGSLSQGANAYEIRLGDYPKGLHRFNYRIGNGKGSWGAVFTKYFYTHSIEEQVVEYECWFDNAYTSKTEGSIGEGSNAINFDIDNLPQGVHFFNFRLGYGNGSWGSVYRKMFLNLSGTEDDVSFEYWIDGDYSAKTTGSLSQGANAYEIRLGDYPKGLHRFNYRIGKGNGSWGAVFTKYFYTPSIEERVTEYEYWLDKDFENRVSGTTASGSVSFDVDLSGFDINGNIHYFNLRTREGDGEWSSVYRKLIMLQDPDKGMAIIGYRHYVNDLNLGYEKVEQNPSNEFSFDVKLPSRDQFVDSDNSDIEADNHSEATDSVCYTLQIQTDQGWLQPVSWHLNLQRLLCGGVRIIYNGRYLTMESDDGEAEIRYWFDDEDSSLSLQYTDVVDVKGLHTVKALSSKDGFLNSEVSEYVVQCYADEEHAETAAGGLLESSFEWSDDLQNALESFRVEGILNEADYRFLNSMHALRHLDISDVKDARIPDAALANMPLVTVSMPADMVEYGDSVFKGDTDICAVVWNSATLQVEQRMMDGFDNPNLLLYMPIADVAKDSGIENRIVSGRAASIVLTDGYPVYVPIEFSAGEISYTRNFSKGTLIGQCSGWETITLPFDVETVKDNVGEAVPFKVAGERDRAFWLYMPGGTGWEKADMIRAYQPYLISMPNNPNYVESYNIHGDVTFSAKNTDIAATPGEEGYLYKGDYKLWPSFRHKVSSLGTWQINDDWYEGDVPGSVFVENLRDVRPFECYITSETGARRILIFDDSGVEQIMSQTGMKIWHENHDLCILSGISRTIRIFDTVGQLVRKVEVEGGVLCRIQDLTPGIYLVDHTKVIIH